MIKKLLTTISCLLSFTLVAQTFVSIENVSITTISTGNDLGIFDDTFSGDSPSTGNYIWTDNDATWLINSLPSFIVGKPLIHTRSSDRTTQGDNTVVQFNVDRYSQIVVWHDRAQSTKPQWLTDNFIACTESVGLFLDTYQADGWCRFVQPGTVSLGGNCPTGGCLADSPMYVVGVIHAQRPLDTEIPPVPGEIQFYVSSVTEDEETTLLFPVERITGTSGSASVTISETTNPGNGVLGTTTLSWANTEGGIKWGSILLADVSGSSVMTLTLSSPSGASLGAISTLTININDLDTVPSALSYYVNPSDPSCSDSNNGTNRTYVSGTNGPWCTLSRSLSVSHPGIGTPGHVTTWIEDGDVRNQLLDPVFSGLSSTQRLRWCAIGGDVNLLGPSSGYMQMAFRMDTNFLQFGGCDSNLITIDGETVFGTGGGQVERGEDPTSVARIRQAGEIFGDDNIVDLDIARTAGWNGIYIDQTATRNVIRTNFGVHGTAYWLSDHDNNPATAPRAEDFGDTIWLDRDSFSPFTLFDGGSTGKNWGPTGHAYNLMGGNFLARGLILEGRWSGNVSTFIGNDGNRTLVISRRSINSKLHDLIVNGSGSPPDQPLTTPCITLEGTGTALINSLIKNCYGPAHNTHAAGWSKNARDIRVAHITYDNLGGPINWSHDWEGTDEGDSNLARVIYKNIIVKDWNNNPACCNSSGDWDDLLFNLGVTPSMPSTERQLDDIFQIHGATIEVGMGETCDDVDILFWSSSTSGVRRSITEWQALYPAAITNITCASDVNLDNSPSPSTLTDFSNISSQYTPVSDSLSIGTGVELTRASAASVGSDTTLPVFDAIYFPDPIPDGSTNWGPPGIGSWSGAYQIHIEGVGNVTYTDIILDGVYPVMSGTIVLSSGQTWLNNARIGFSQSVGGTTPAPNRGVIR